MTKKHLLVIKIVAVRPFSFHGRSSSSMNTKEQEVWGTIKDSEKTTAVKATITRTTIVIKTRNVMARIIALNV